MMWTASQRFKNLRVLFYAADGNVAFQAPENGTEQYEVAPAETIAEDVVRGICRRYK